MPIKNMK